ncbi:MAG: carbohydrate kinase family protein [Chloroflexota bacterium]
MPYDIVVSGHLCADLLPETSNLALSALSSPGKLFEVDALEIATGGSVSNTGLALHKLGIKVGMMTTVGDDLLGRVIIAKLKDRDPTLGDMIAIREDEASSYSIILSPQNTDRIILHCTGNNQHFGKSDIDFDVVKQAKIFHLGYPPLLPQLYADGGQEMMEIYQQIYDYGVLTSLDMAHPDPNGSSGKVNWKQVLEETLPYVDIFLPSIEEIVFMFRQSDYDNWNGNIVQNVSQNYLRHLADELLSMGSIIVGFKLGELGFYLRTSDNNQKLIRLKNIGQSIDSWHNLDLWHPAYDVDVVGTTGAGDSAYGGFLAALLNGLDAHEALDVTCAVGACNVEAHDAISGVLDWDATLERVRANWRISTLQLE